MEKTSMGLDENVAGLLCYVLGWITGLVFFLIEPNNKFVRFHAIQSMVVFGALTVAGIIFGFVPVIGGFVSWVIYVLGIILWIILMVKAYQGNRYKLPISGDIAEKNSQ